MVERWWGRRDVHAEDFAALVRPQEGGIRTDDMTSTMRSRGWTVQAGSGSVDALQRAVRDSTPAIALIRVATDRYHFVVVIGWSGSRVTYHDPTVAPAVTLDTAAFIQRWTGARRWALVARPGPVIPSAPPASVTTTASPTSIDSLPCRPWLDRAADAASARDFALADTLLSTAAASCPDEPLRLRELAGVRFRQARYPEATRLAEDYTRRVPGDSLAWQLLASSRYLDGDARGALRAWNSIGQPTIDILRVDGITRTRWRVFADAIALHDRDVLSSGGLALARRRLADVPSLAVARIAHAPLPGGTAEVRASVRELPLLDPLPQLLFETAVDAVFRRDASLSLASPLRLGELWTVQWRWQPADPRVAVRVTAPVHVGVPVVVRLERSWETYNYSSALALDRRSASIITVRSWARPWLETLAGVRHERWTDRSEYAALTVGAGLHDAGDHVALLTEGEHATPVGSGVAYDRIRTSAEWMPPADRWQTRWSLRLGAQWTTAGTPVALQPLAGGDRAREIPLRAHPFIIDRRLPAARIGRMITHGGVSADRDLLRRGLLALGAGVFLDGAHIRSPADAKAAASRLFLDVGAGLRIGLAGTQWSALRIDVARGVTSDRRWGLTAGLAPAWPVRLGRGR